MSEISSLWLASMLFPTIPTERSTSVHPCAITSKFKKAKLIKVWQLTLKCVCVRVSLFYAIGLPPMDFTISRFHLKIAKNLGLNSATIPFQSV